MSVDLTAAVVGEQWRIGTVVLAVTQPRLPCFKLGMRMGDASFVGKFENARRYGAYLRIVGAGELVAGDPIVLVERPTHGIRLADLVRAHNEPTRALLERIVACGDVPDGWRASAARTLRRLPTGAVHRSDK